MVAEGYTDDPKCWVMSNKATIWYVMTCGSNREDIFSQKRHCAHSMQWALYKNVGVGCTEMNLHIP